MPALRQFLAGGDEREAALARAQEVVPTLPPFEARVGVYYLKIMKNVIKKGDSYLQAECAFACTLQLCPGFALDMVRKYVGFFFPFFFGGSLVLIGAPSARCCTVPDIVWPWWWDANFARC